MRKKPKLSGPLNLAPEHRLFLKGISKSTKYPPPGLVYPSTWVATADVTPLHYLFHSLPPYLYLHCVIPLVAAHFWNRDHTNSFSLITLPPTLILIVTHHTSHRISGIVQRGSRNRPPLIDSSAVLPRSSTRFPHPICSRLLSWAFVILRTRPLYNPRTMFSELLFLAPMPPSSVPIVFPHLSFW